MMVDKPGRPGRRVLMAVGAVVLAALVGGAGLVASVRPVLPRAGVASVLPRAEVAYNPYNLVRLHVLAASDRPEDQALKLQARDRVIDFLSSRWGDVHDTSGALAVLEANRDELCRLLEELISSEGRDYGVSLQVGYFPFPERRYGDLTLPAGTYPALRVILGEGAGQNWWCVLFPPLCFLDARVGMPTAVPAAVPGAVPSAIPLSLEESALSPAGGYEVQALVAVRPEVRLYLLDWLRRHGLNAPGWVKRWREGTARP